MKETIIFNNNASGTIVINFEQNGRIDKFGSDFQILACNVAEGTETKIQGFGITKTLFGALITCVTLDGIYNSGYITLIKNDEKNIICTANCSACNA